MTMINGCKKRNRWFGFELQSSHIILKSGVKDLQKLKCEDTNQTTDQIPSQLFFWCYKVFDAISVLFIASSQTVGEFDLAKKVLLKITCCNVNAIVFFLK